MRKTKWTEVPAEEAATATYFRVRCNICGFETVKLGGRNVTLCRVGHHRGHHFGHAMDYSVVPVKRAETVGRA
jgi:hypothetical protein